MIVGLLVKGNLGTIQPCNQTEGRKPCSEVKAVEIQSHIDCICMEVHGVLGLSNTLGPEESLRIDEIPDDFIIVIVFVHIPRRHIVWHC